MHVVINTQHELHAPPWEIENGEVIPCFECSPRLAAIRTALEAAGGFTFENATTITDAELAAVHDHAFIAYLRETSAELREAPDDAAKIVWPTVFPYGPSPHAGGPRSRCGRFCFDTYTPIMAGTFDAVSGGAAAAQRAAELVASNAERMVYVLTRPPGHHAERDRCGGYCYFNNAAIAAERLARLGRVAVLDLDVHHGNGTQHIFYERPDVVTVSVHGDPAALFPFFSGYTDETGSGAGLGFNRNLLLPSGTDSTGYQPALLTAIETVSRFRPAFLVLAFGPDAHEADPIGGLKLPTEFFGVMGKAVRDLGLPTVVTQEGGYHLETLGACVVELLNALRIA